MVCLRERGGGDYWRIFYRCVERKRAKENVQLIDEIAQVDVERFSCTACISILLYILVPVNAARTYLDPITDRRQ